MKYHAIINPVYATIKDEEEQVRNNSKTPGDGDDRPVVEEGRNELRVEDHHCGACTCLTNVSVVSDYVSNSTPHHYHFLPHVSCSVLIRRLKIDSSAACNMPSTLAVRRDASTVVVGLYLVRTALQQIGKGAIEAVHIPLCVLTGQTMRIFVRITCQCSSRRSSMEIGSFWLLSCSGWLREARSHTVVVSLVKTPVNSDAL